VLNLAAGLRDAHLAHAPVIAITGRDPHTKFRQVYWGAVPPSEVHHDVLGAGADQNPPMSTTR
jgi:thiamine pyrophosphate-dependent acetolactate synthase large subunit-like protein